MRRLVSFLLGCAGLAIASPVSAATFIPVAPVAGATRTEADAINDKNEIIGVYFDSQESVHGFAGTLNGNYQTFDVGSANTLPSGIDKKGNIVGTSFTSAPDCTASAFARSSKGKTQPIKKGSTAIAGTVTSMAANGDFVGIYCDGGGSHLFVGKKAKYKKDIALSGPYFLLSSGGINDSDDIDGSAEDPTITKIVGFFVKDGTTTEVTYPGADQTQLAGLNDKGMATGLYITGGKTHGFVYDTSTKKFTSVEPTGATTSGAYGINNAGLVAVTSDAGAFIYCPLKQNKCPTSGTR